MERKYVVPGAAIPLVLFVLVVLLLPTQAATFPATTDGAGAPSLQATDGAGAPPLQATDGAGAPPLQATDGAGAPPLQAAIADTILRASRESLGQKMWLRHSDLVGNGVFACASSVTGVLQRAGIHDADSALVSTMRKQLLARPNTQEILLKSPGDPYLDDREMLALLRPGDIIVGTMDTPEAENAGAAAHTAIYVSPELVYSNNSDDGYWIEAPTHVLFDRFTYVEAIRLN